MKGGENEKREYRNHITFFPFRKEVLLSGPAAGLSFPYDEGIKSSLHKSGASWRFLCLHKMSIKSVQG